MGKRKFVCPSCKGKTGVNIVYGEPADPEAATRGEVFFGGCCVIAGDENSYPDRKCLKCGHEWLIRRRNTRMPTLVPLETELCYVDDSQIAVYDSDEEEWEDLYTTGMKPEEFGNKEEGKAYRAWVEKNKDRLFEDYGDMDVL